MKTIYRISLEWTSNQTINLPQSAKILSCKVLGPTGTPSIWFEFDTADVDWCNPHTIYMVGTGTPLPEVPGVKFLDTIQKVTNNDNNLYVFHVYYKLN